VDTNCDPDTVDHVIPGNDDAIRGIKLIANAVAETVKRAADEYAHAAAENAKKRESDRAAEETRRAAARAEVKAKKPEGEKPAAAEKAKKTVKDSEKAGARPRAGVKKPAKTGAEEPLDTPVQAVEPSPEAENKAAEEPSVS